MINSAKPILVLLPGLDGTGRLFTPLRRELPKDIESVVLPYPPDTPLTYDDLCNSLAHELPTDPFVILGESFGGPLAILLSHRAKNNLKGIILCASYIINPHPLLARFLQSVLSPSVFRREPPTWAIRSFLIGGLSDEKLLKNIKSATREVAQEVFYMRLREIADVNVSEQLENIKLPILYLQATRDRLVSSSSLKLIRSFNENVQSHAFEAPHMLLQVEPKKTAEVIHKFVQTVI